MKPKLLLALLAAGILTSGCVCPCISTAENSRVRGVRPETGEAIVSKEVTHPIFSPVPFESENHGKLTIHYYLRKGSSEKRLGFLHEQYPVTPMLYEILPIRGTQRWAAFRTTAIRRETADLKMIIFDQRGVQRELEIPNALRTHAEPLYSRIANFSIQLCPDSGRIMITTSSGLTIYDLPTDGLTFEGR